MNHLTKILRTTKSRNGFTLVELLAIIAIILVLTGITFGVSKGVLNQQARARSQAELAMIAQALEAFKLTYGDYPVIGQDDGLTNANARELTKALTGFSYLRPGTIPGSREMTDVGSGNPRKSFIDVEQLSLSKPFRDPDNPANVPNSVADFDQIYLVDPWRQSYVYLYNRGSSANTWDTVGYLLFSKGPDEEADGIDADTGILDTTTAKNRDNIYPNQ